MKKPRIWYSYNGVKYLVPERFIYQMHESRGGGFEISVDFFTWAFNKHGISIIKYNTIYGNQTDMRPAAKTREEKEKIPASIVYFAVECIGRDRNGKTFSGYGEVGNESINNFQRGFPYGLAAKRAKVNMGKEFFELTNVKLAIDPRDYPCNHGKYKKENNNGKIYTLSEVYKIDKKYVEFLASDDFNTLGQADYEILHTKAKELLEWLEEYKEYNAVAADKYICDYGKYFKNPKTLEELYETDKEFLLRISNTDINTGGKAKYEVLKRKVKEFLKTKQKM